MARLAMHFVTILFAVIISEFFILQTNATYFIELVDGLGPGRLRLFDCPMPISAARTNEVISCTEVTDDNTKSRIYSTANFYVTSLPQLNGKQKFKVGGSFLAAVRHFHDIFVGVTIIEGDTQSPEFLKDKKSAITKQLGQISKFKKNVDVNSVVTFMTFVNFRAFSEPTPEITTGFIQYVKVMENLQQIHAENALRAATQWGNSQPNGALMNEIILAVLFLLKKMIDPCFTLRHNPTLANTLCDKQCKFLTIGFAVFPEIHTPECNRAIGFGSCQSTVCMCAIRTVLFNCQCGLTYSAMIRCSNTLRTGIANTYYG